MADYYGVDGGAKFNLLRQTGRGRQFLNRRVSELICREPLDNFRVADLGCGSGVVTKLLLQQNARFVYANDVQQTMIAEAQRTLADLGPDALSRLRLEVGDVCRLDDSIGRFDRLLSVNVHCNLTAEQNQLAFAEIARVKAEEGQVIFTYPTSLERVFTTDRITSAEAIGQIRTCIKGVDPRNAEEVRAALGSLGEILFATFYLRGGRLKLFVEGETPPDVGEAIWRLIPGPFAVPNFYFPPSFYQQCYTASGLHQLEHFADCFASDAERLEYNSSKPELALGDEYAHSACFAVDLLA